MQYYLHRDTGIRIVRASGAGNRGISGLILIDLQLITGWKENRQRSEISRQLKILARN